MKIEFSPPDITEREIEAVTKTLRSGWITTGPKTKEFEREIGAYLGTNKVVCLNSATAALELALRILDIGPGDEVITTPYTYTASASVIDHVGAKIVMVDIEDEDLEMDYDKVKEVITPKTKAIIPVDIGGVPCDYDRIKKVLEEKKDIFSPKNDLGKALGRVAIIADAAHAFGALYMGESVSRHADFSCYSFHAVKNLTTGEGGCITWRDGFADDEKTYKDLQLLSLHGQNKDALAKTKLGSWEYDIKAPNYKCNMTDIMAAVGLVQLERYSGMLARRREIIEAYNDKFKGTRVHPLVHFTEDKISSGHLYLVNIDGIGEGERNEIIEKMAERNIACNVHYKPLPMHTAYKNLGFDIKDYPHAYKRYESLISLPLHTLLTDEEVDFVGDSLLEIESDY